MSRTQACVGRESRGVGRRTRGIQRSLRLGPCDSLTPCPDSRKTLRQFNLKLRAALEEVAGDLDSSGGACGWEGGLAASDVLSTQSPPQTENSGPEVSRQDLVMSWVG